MATGILTTEYLGVTIVAFQDMSILDSVVVEEISQQLYGLVDQKALRKITLDFSNVRFMSSSMIGAIMALHRKAKAINGRIVLCGMHDDLMKVFKMLKLDKVLQFVKTEEDALKAFDVR
jgi:anti-sigma B factor antagonist